MLTHRGNVKWKLYQIVTSHPLECVLLYLLQIVHNLIHFSFYRTKIRFHFIHAITVGFVERNKKKKRRRKYLKADENRIMRAPGTSVPKFVMNYCGKLCGKRSAEHWQTMFWLTNANENQFYIKLTTKCKHKNEHSPIYAPTRSNKWTGCG